LYVKYAAIKAVDRYKDKLTSTRQHSNAQSQRFNPPVRAHKPRPQRFTHQIRHFVGHQQLLDSSSLPNSSRPVTVTPG